jgi:pyruvate kinase
MLSEETTLGQYPTKAVEVMSRVAKHTEENFDYEEILKHNHLRHRLVVDSISYSVVNVAHNIGAKAILALTESGFTSRMISRCKPKQPIIALTPNEKTYNRLALSFGCRPLIITGFKNILKVIESAKKIALQQKIAEKGDKIVICAGIPFGRPGTTNTLIVETI